MPQLSIVIPAYNEEKKIAKDIEAVYEYFKEYKIDGELIIVDDGSKDDTYNFANSFIKNYPSLKVLNYGRNRGKGYAVKTGILNATGDYILVADSGICVPYKCANDGLELLKQGNDIAIGSRRIADKKRQIVKNQPLYRRLGSKVFHFLINTFNVIPPGIDDTQCGFKLFKKEAAHNIFKKMFTEKFMWDVEMLRRVVKEKYKVVPFGVQWSNDPDTRYNPLIGSIENMIQILTIMVRV